MVSLPLRPQITAGYSRFAGCPPGGGAAPQPGATRAGSADRITEARGGKFARRQPLLKELGLNTVYQVSSSDGKRHMCMRMRTRELRGQHDAGKRLEWPEVMAGGSTFSCQNTSSG